MKDHAEAFYHALSVYGLSSLAGGLARMLVLGSESMCSGWIIFAKELAMIMFVAMPIGLAFGWVSESYVSVQLSHMISISAAIGSHNIVKYLATVNVKEVFSLVAEFIKLLRK